MRYSPFSKPLNDVTAADLAILREVSEGWYIEYKREFPGSMSAAKSVCAFANSYGGWLFYGISESPDGKHAAGGFVGLPLTDIPNILQRLTQAIATQATPSPFIEHRIVTGPEDSVALPKERGILIVKVPMGNNPPYLHSSGRIYRRVADASDPKAETDRHLVDMLWQRSQETRKTFAHFVDAKPEFAQDEGYSYLKLFLLSDPWREQGLISRLSYKTFAEIMEDSSIDSGGIPFDNIFTSSTGFVARQIKNNDPYKIGFTWCYDRGTTSEITLAFNATSMNAYARPTPLEFLNGYKIATRFLSACGDVGINNGTLIDLSQLFIALQAIIKRHRILMQHEGLKRDLFAKLQIGNVWRRIPFIDLISYADFVERRGVPIVQTNNIVVPPGQSPDDCLLLSAPEQSTTDAAHYVDAATILLFTCNAMGIPMDVFGLHVDTSGTAFATLCEMGETAKHVAANRKI